MIVICMTVVYLYFSFMCIIHVQCAPVTRGVNLVGNWGGGRWQTAFGSKLLTRKNDRVETSDTVEDKNNKEAVLPQGNRAMPQVFFSVEVRQQHSLQV